MPVSPESSWFAKRNAKAVESPVGFSLEDACAEFAEDQRRPKQRRCGSEYVGGEELGDLGSDAGHG